MTAFATLLRFAGWTLCLAPLQCLLLALRAPFARKLPMIWHRGVGRILGFRIERYGAM